MLHKILVGKIAEIGYFAELCSFSIENEQLTPKDYSLGVGS
jgi:hypothetical protein